MFQNLFYYHLVRQDDDKELLEAIIIWKDFYLTRRMVHSSQFKFLNFVSSNWIPLSQKFDYRYSIHGFLFSTGKSIQVLHLNALHHDGKVRLVHVSIIEHGGIAIDHSSSQFDP